LTRFEAPSNSACQFGASCYKAVPSFDLETTMAKNKTAVGREWTATDIRKLKGYAKKKIGADKIARTLKRTAGATKVKASSLGISLDTRG